MVEEIRGKRDSTSGSVDDKQLELAHVEDTTAVAQDPGAEKALMRKIDRRLLPVLYAMYFFAFIDRGNIGNARLMNLPEDVLGGDASGKLFDWITSAFYFTYITVQIPATITSKLFRPRVWLGCCAIAWGISSTLQATAFNFAGLIVCRLFIGVFEAAFGPGIPVYMSLFYTKREIGLRLACYQSFAAIGSAFSGLIAFGIQQVHASVANWKLLFIIEGVPTVIIGTIAVWALPNRPEDTRMLDPAEKELAISRMRRGTNKEESGTVNVGHIKLAFKDWREYALMVGVGVIWFGMNIALASLSAFLPTIIKTFGFQNAAAQLLTVPPYAVAALVMISASYISDRIQSRGLIMACMTFIGGIGYLILLTVNHNIHAQYFATFCVTSGTYATIGLNLAWYAHNLGSETKKATGLPIYMAIGQCGSVLGSHIFPLTESPHYVKGFAISCAMQFLACIMCLILTTSYRRENRRRDALYGRPHPDEPVEGMAEHADEAPMFRYVP
ncbi:MFS general substrate transporter [Auricularia subglabra TFB-10046 SS5]|nr:MFS general substrate transporter [Auricularia subglabra TFB-10046 SS5]